MRRRLVFVLVLSLLLVAAIATVVLANMDARLPAEAQDELERYLATLPVGVTVADAARARYPVRFSPAMGQQIVAPARYEAHQSPGLYDSQVIRPPLDPGPLPFPAQEVWCVRLTRDGDAIESLYVTRHEHLYGDNWGLFRMPADHGDDTARIGCEVTP